MKRVQFAVDWDATQDAAGWFLILPVGKYMRASREVEITLEMLREAVNNFHAGIPMYRVPVTANHEDIGGKYGDLVDLAVHDDAGLWGRFDWLERGLRVLGERSFQYLSAELQISPLTYEGKEYQNILQAVSFVNDPYFPETALYSVGGRPPARAMEVEEAPAAYTEEWYREFTRAEREKLAKEGAALPDGSFPIVTVADLRNAIQAVGRAGPGKRAQVIAHIRKRARALVREGKLSAEEWQRIRETSSLFSSEGGDEDMTENILVDKGLFERLLNSVGIGRESPVETEAPTGVAKFQAELDAKEAERARLERELDVLRAQKETNEADRRREALLAKFSVALTVEDGGIAFKAPDGLPGALAAIAEESEDGEKLADQIVEHFRAVMAQKAVPDLTGEIGADSGKMAAAEPAEQFTLRVAELVKAGKSEVEANVIVAKQHPDLYRAFRRWSSAETARVSGEGE